jgi:hypothetical protein
VKKGKKEEKLLSLFYEIEFHAKALCRDVKFGSLLCETKSARHSTPKISRNIYDDNPEAFPMI